MKKEKDDWIEQRSGVIGKQKKRKGDRKDL